jgi:hypothetical protein
VFSSPKGSIELVGELFEVRTQVDRDLTSVSRVDQRLGLIKNLGCHNTLGFVHRMYRVYTTREWILYPEFQSLLVPGIFTLGTNGCISTRWGGRPPTHRPIRDH